MEDLPFSQRQKGDYFAWLGRFVPEKGAHRAIEAAKRAHVPLVLAGFIDRHVKESMDYFEKEIKPQVGTDQITYVGPVNMKQKIKLFGRARGFLNPSEWEEPFGMVMIEAMALGCPIITFARGAAPEIVVDAVTGLLVNSVDEMVRCMPRIDEIDREVEGRHVERQLSYRFLSGKHT